MSFLSTTIPWGSPVVESIPLPPFASEDEHRRYVTLLQLHIALLDGGAPSLPSIALSAAIAPPNWPTGKRERWLSPTELSVSLSTWFPAPWTPEALAQTLKNAGFRFGPRASGENWSWDGDPDFGARPDPAGGWSITRHERGSVTTEHLESDRDLTLLWIEHHRARFVLPLGVRHDEADIAALAPASLAVRIADEVDGEYPYRTAWVTERTAALGQAAITLPHIAPHLPTPHRR